MKKIQSKNEQPTQNDAQFMLENQCEDMDWQFGKIESGTWRLCESNNSLWRVFVFSRFFDKISVWPLDRLSWGSLVYQSRFHGCFCSPFLSNALCFEYLVFALFQLDRNMSKIGAYRFVIFSTVGSGKFQVAPWLMKTYTPLIWRITLLSFSSSKLVHFLSDQFGIDDFYFVLKVSSMFIMFVLSSSQNLNTSCSIFNHH